MRSDSNLPTLKADTATLGVVPETAPLLTRHAYFGPHEGWRQAAVAQRRALNEGWTAAGPLLIEDRASTIVVGPGERVAVDGEGNVIVEQDGGTGG